MHPTNIIHRTHQVEFYKLMQFYVGTVAALQRWMVREECYKLRTEFELL
jgi:hypothetical protein